MSRASMNARSSSSIAAWTRCSSIRSARRRASKRSWRPGCRRGRSSRRDHAPSTHRKSTSLRSATRSRPARRGTTIRAIGWPAAAAEADPRLRFTVRAVYGKRTDEIAAWLDEAAAGAEVLVVQGGINDIAQGRAVADAAENLRTMIRAWAGARPAGRRRERPPLEQRLAARRGFHPPAERADRGDGRAGAAVPRHARGSGTAWADARRLDVRGRSPVDRGLPTARRASLPPSMSSCATAPAR